MPLLTEREVIARGNLYLDELFKAAGRYPIEHPRTFANLPFKMTFPSGVPIFTDAVSNYPINMDMLKDKMAYWRRQWLHARATEQIENQQIALWHLNLLVHYWNKFIDAEIPGPYVYDTYADKYGAPIGASAFVNHAEKREVATEQPNLWVQSQTRKRMNNLQLTPEQIRFENDRKNRLVSINDFPNPPPGTRLDGNFGKNLTQFGISMIRSMLHNKGYVARLRRSIKGRPNEWMWEFRSARGMQADVIQISCVANNIWAFEVVHNNMVMPFFVQNDSHEDFMRGIPPSLAKGGKDWKGFTQSEVDTYRSGWTMLQKWIMKSV